MVDVFRKGKFELLALKETKLKGNGEVSHCGVNGIIAGVEEREKFWNDLVAIGRKVEGAIKSLVNARVLQLESVRMLHEVMLVLILLYGSELMIWREKERSRIRDV